MSLNLPAPEAHKHNCKKTSAPLRQKQYNSKPHTPHDKCGASAKVNPPPYNQQAPQIIHNKKKVNSIQAIPPSLFPTVTMSHTEKYSYV